MKTFSVLSGLALCFSTGSLLAQIVVYDNSAPSNWDRAFLESTHEYGDEIQLSPSSPRAVSTFAVQYYAENFSGNERVQVRFYKNDGPDSTGGFPTPSTVVYDSGPVALPTTPGNQVLTLNNLQVTVPDSFTWTVEFSGVAGTERAGLAVTDPAAVGSGFNDFWQRINGSWDLYVFPQVQGEQDPGSFGAAITAVPEPLAAAWMGSVLAIAAVLARRLVPACRKRS